MIKRGLSQESKADLIFFRKAFFSMQNLLSLIRPRLFIFVFIFIILGGRSKKILLWFMSKLVLPREFVWRF